MNGFIFRRGYCKSSGSCTRKQAVISASLEIIQLFSTASNGNLLSSVVAFDLFLIDTFGIQLKIAMHRLTTDDIG
jgi:hypothetical protein